MTVLPSTLSGFRLRRPVREIQKDSLKPRGFALVSATAGTSELRSASFPGIEVRGSLIGTERDATDCQTTPSATPMITPSKRFPEST
jgi:hypothetical protein